MLCGPRSATNLRSRVTDAQQLGEHSAAGRCRVLSCAQYAGKSVLGDRAYVRCGVVGGTHCTGWANEKWPSSSRCDPKSSLRGGALLPLCQLELRPRPRPLRSPPCVAGASVTELEQDTALRSGVVRGCERQRSSRHVRGRRCISAGRNGTVCSTLSLGTRCPARSLWVGRVCGV